jgi:hypothetical protein
MLEIFSLYCYFFLAAGSSSSLESLSNTSTGIPPVPSPSLFSGQTRSMSPSSYTRQISSENPNRLSMTSSLSSSKFESLPTTTTSSSRSTPIPQTTNLASKTFVIY